MPQSERLNDLHNCYSKTKQYKHKISIYDYAISFFKRKFGDFEFKNFKKNENLKHNSKQSNHRRDR